MAKAKDEKMHGNMFWKGVAMAFIAVFIVIIIIGLVRFYTFQPRHFAAQPVQTGIAEKAVADDLSQRGDNISNYKVQVSDMARGFTRNGMNKSIIQISLSDGSTRQIYLVDSDSGQIVMHSETTFYGWMGNQTPPEAPGPEPFWGR